MAPGGEWLAVFTRAGFDQTQARQALGELPVTRQPDGSLDAVDISTAAASGEYPTFIQTLMDGLRAAANAAGGYFTAGITSVPRMANHIRDRHTTDVPEPYERHWGPDSYDQKRDGPQVQNPPG